MASHSRRRVRDRQTSKRSGVAIDLIQKLGARFNVNKKVVTATSISNLTNWPDTLHDAKGTQLTL